ncbi:MAG: GNAT family N-acetyltransferase [Anaerolineales bacterium]|nr:GNAT family N-acetyltransferase [Anaerolineales bacterium]
MNVSRRIELKSRDESILLRPPRMEDVPAIYDAIHLSMQELMQWMNWCHPDYSSDETREWIKNLIIGWERGEEYQFGIFDAESGQFMGACGLNHINRYYLLANLGYWVRSDRTNEGVATQATVLVAQFGFQELGLRRLEIVTGVNNKASSRVAEKTGAHFEGILRQRLKLGDRNIDAAMYSLIPGDFA